MKMAYADPPYVGWSSLYKDHPDYAGEVDHKALIGRLMEEFKDGWALSCTSSSLRLLLPMAPEKVRVLSWVKPDAQPNQNPIYSWEPVLLWKGRKRQKDRGYVRDFLVLPFQKRDNGFIGAKPPAFCWWIFDCLGLLPDDDFHDLFPGSGAVWRAWESYRQGWVPSAKTVDTPMLDGVL